MPFVGAGVARPKLPCGVWNRPHSELVLKCKSGFSRDSWLLLQSFSARRELCDPCFRRGGKRLLAQGVFIIVFFGLFVLGDPTMVF